MRRKIWNYFYLLIVVSVLFIMTAVVVANASVDDEYKITSPSDFNIKSPIKIVPTYDGVRLSSDSMSVSVGEKTKVQLKLFGIIPVKDVDVEVVNESYVAVLGIPFGIRLYTDGVLVVDISEVDTSFGKMNPAKSAGIKKGDYITYINGVKMTSNEEVQKIIEESNGNPLEVMLNRNGNVFTVEMLPAFSEETGSYKGGMWVLDSSAGIGTLTFYSPANNVMCGLGHPISDSETGVTLSVESGQMVKADIFAVEKSVKGEPGELKGRLGISVLADLNENCELGVYGEAKCNVSTKNLTQVALKQEVTDGNATVICTVDGNEPDSYSCKIKVKNTKVGGTEQNLIVEITDERLLSTTGGIVQGMSGSPIIQNGKLIGAITHVLVDDPTTGYAIFAENMLETAQSVANENKLKEAS